MNAFITPLLAFGATVLCVTLLAPISGRLRLIDQPDNRKDHVGAIPLVGGIAVWLGFTITLLFVGMSPKLAVLILAGGMLTMVGAVDDAIELSAKVRLVLHIIAALLMCFLGGVIVLSLGELLIPGKDLSLCLAAIPFTVFAVVALINASNMSDGLDGLCGLQMLVPLAGLAVLSGYSGNNEHFLPLLAICGAVAGFLLFNLRTPWRSKATVFLGDAGSNFLGLLLAWFLIDMSQGDDAILRPVSALWFALLLIYDTVEVVARRLVRRKSPFVADREHLHHVFLMAKFSPSETVMTMGGIAALGTLIGMASTLVDIPDSAMFAAFVLFGLLFLRWIFHTWSVMRFLQRSICRRRGERRTLQTDFWGGPERRSGEDRRTERRKVSDEKG